MDESKGILNIGDLAQPVTTLIEKIADATGVLFEPRKIKRLAKAQAEVDLIKAKSEIEISDLQRRALSRFVQEEGKKQENLEKVMEKTIPLLEEGAKPEEMDDDWIMNFFDKAKLVSDEKMQIIWAKILAGEANQANSFSKRTVNTVGSLDKSDADLFATLGRFSIENSLPLIFDFKDSIYSNFGLTFSNLTHLDNIGLINFNNITGFTLILESRIIKCNYFDTSLFLDFEKDTQNSLKIGTVSLSQSGRELSKLWEAEPIPLFIDYLIENFKKQEGLKVLLEEPIQSG